MNLKHTMDLDHVNKAIIENYRNLRTRIGILAFAFPIILVVIGLCWGIGVRPALSDYYFAEDPVSSRLDHTPVRLWFCGILFVVGFFLHRYRGFSKNEDRWLSVAGTFTLGVAIFPETFDGRNEYSFVLAPLGVTQISLHAICAVLAFLCIAVVIVWYADSTLSELEHSHPSDCARYKRIYRAIAIFMVVSIGISISLKYLLGHPADKPDIWTFAGFWQTFSIILAETCGIWAFAAYWFVKNSELSLVAEQVKKAHGKMAPSKLTKPDIIDKL